MRTPRAPRCPPPPLPAMHAPAHRAVRTNACTLLPRFRLPDVRRRLRSLRSASAISCFCRCASCAHLLGNPRCARSRSSLHAIRRVSTCCCATVRAFAKLITRPRARVRLPLLVAPRPMPRSCSARIERRIRARADKRSLELRGPARRPRGAIRELIRPCARASWSSHPPSARRSSRSFHGCELSDERDRDPAGRRCAVRGGTQAEPDPRGDRQQYLRARPL